MCRALAAVAASLLLVSACGGPCQPAARPRCPQGAAGESGPAAAGGAAKSPGQGARGILKVPPPPEGYVEMFALMVAPVGDGNAVLIGDEKRTIFIPIIIGGTEAVAITYRMHDEEFPRPVTHDLLDTILARVGGRLVKVQVDKLEAQTFIGSVYIRYKGEIIEIDARPSDAIALATGNDVPIYVAKSVIDKAGLTRKDLGGGDDLAPTTMPPAPDVPEPLRPK